MTTRNLSNAIKDNRRRLKDGKEKLEQIRASADAAKPGLEAAANEVEDALENLLKLGDRLGEDFGPWRWLRPFIRRMSSREFIIAVVAIVAIWSGGLDAQEAIAVAAAGGGLALGRGVAKARTGGSDA